MDIHQKDKKMSKAHFLDEQKTILQVKKPNPVDGKTTWLRHKIGSEAGTIDLLILEGINTIQNMVRFLEREPAFLKKTYRQWERRIMNHIEHLSTVEGDARDRIRSTGGHNLKVKISDLTGVVFFDYK